MSKIIPERIRSLRLKHGYTQQTLAEYLNVTQKTYSDYELGKSTIGVNYLLRIAEFYGVGMDYICGLTDTI